MFRLFKKYRKSSVLMIALLVVLAVSLGTNSTKSPTYPSIPGFGGLVSWTGTLGASADTNIITLGSPINGNTRDSIDLVFYTYSSASGRASMSVRLQQSMNGVTWTKSTTLGTDSTSYVNVGGTQPTTLALANHVAFPIGYLRYGTYPYYRLLIYSPTTGNTVQTVWTAYLSINKAGQ